MANRLTQRRKKCIKSPNIFRDKQEYSSLYTISSRSASSIHSSEMASQITKQSYQNRMYKGQHQKGDAINMPVDGKNQYYGNKYPKLPSDISQELQQKFYSNSYKNYYNQRSQFIKNKFDSLSLENKQQYPKQHWPMHVGMDKYVAPAGQAPPPNHYVINRLEETYWAQWKPNKCAEYDTWRNYMNQQACSRRPHCNVTPMLPHECMNMHAQTKKCPKSKCREEKPLQIIREPAEIRESNSSDEISDGKKSKSKCSCCPCPRDENSKSDEESSQHVQFSEENREYEATEEEQNLDTSQEEYENLYNEMYMEYENHLMDRISEYELQKEEQEMREMEKRLAEEEAERLRNLPAQSSSVEMLDVGMSKAFENDGEKRVSAEGKDGENEPDTNSNEYAEPEIAILKHTDSFIINSRRQKEDRPRKPQPKFIKLSKPAYTPPPPVKGHTYPLKPTLKKEKPPAQPIIGFSRPFSPNTPKVRTPSKQFLPSYLLRH